MRLFITKDGRSCTAEEALDERGMLKSGYGYASGLRQMLMGDAARAPGVMIRDNGQEAYERNLRTAHLSDDGQGLAAAVHAERMLIDSEARQAALYADACARALASRPDEQALADSRRAYNDRISNAYKG